MKKKPPPVICLKLLLYHPADGNMETCHFCMNPHQSDMEEKTLHRQGKLLSVTPRAIYSSPPPTPHPHSYADARVYTAVSGIVTLAELVKRNTRLVDLCG